MNISPRLSLFKEEKNGWRIWTEQCWKSGSSEDMFHAWSTAQRMQRTDFYVQGSPSTTGWYHNCRPSLVGGSNASCFGRLLHWRLDYLRHTHEEKGRRSLFSTQVPHQWALFEYSSSFCSYSGHNSTDRCHFIPEDSWWQMLLHRYDGSASASLITRHQRIDSFGTRVTKTD